MAKLSRKELNVRHELIEALLECEFPGNASCVAAMKLQKKMYDMETYDIAVLIRKSVTSRMHNYLVLYSGFRNESRRATALSQRLLFERF